MAHFARAVSLGENLAKEIESLGRVLLQFYRAVNLLYRKSVEGKQPEWVARWLDLGKPRELIELQRSPAFKNEIPRVIRPDILLDGKWFQHHGTGFRSRRHRTDGVAEPDLFQCGLAGEGPIIGGADGMIARIRTHFWRRRRTSISSFPKRRRPTGRKWNGSPGKSKNSEFKVQIQNFEGFTDGDAVYRFFELFDLPNVANAQNDFRTRRGKRKSS